MKNYIKEPSEMKLALLGGTFNPIHNGHLTIARVVYQRLGVEKVHLIPAGNPPHKNTEDLVSYADRIRMIELSIAETPYLEVSQLDCPAMEKSYTKQLIEKYRTAFPDSRLYFVIGSDNIPQLKTWHCYRWLLANVTFVALTRKGFAYSQFENLEYSEQIVKLDIEPVNISSEMIRNCLKEGKSVEGLVPNQVLEYIRKNRLYS